jgi:hypothetical protein
MKHSSTCTAVIFCIKSFVKSPNILLAAMPILFALAGCAQTDVVAIGRGTYMVNRGGWPAMNGFACEAKCYEAANAFCEKNHLAIASSTPTTIDGRVFAHNASSKLVFTTTKKP